ncbi:MAG: hypothetical protein ACK56I_02450, partial [bacterium]
STRRRSAADRRETFHRRGVRGARDGELRLAMRRRHVHEAARQSERAGAQHLAGEAQDKLAIGARDVREALHAFHAGEELQRAGHRGGADRGSGARRLGGDMVREPGGAGSEARVDRRAAGAQLLQAGDRRRDADRRAV